VERKTKIEELRLPIGEGLNFTRSPNSVYAVYDGRSPLKQHPDPLQPDVSLGETHSLQQQCNTPKSMNATQINAGGVLPEERSCCDNPRKAKCPSFTHSKVRLHSLSFAVAGGGQIPHCLSTMLQCNCLDTKRISKLTMTTLSKEYNTHPLFAPKQSP
jgi:hypothetical protein